MIELGSPLFAVIRITRTSNFEECSMFWIMLILFHQTSNLLIKKLCCMCLKTMKQWSRWLLKEGVLQCDMFPGLTELHLIGYLIESIWTPKSKSNTLTPKTNSQTYWPREISHVTSGIIFCVYLTLAISVMQSVPKWCRKERKKNQVKKESQQSQDQWWIWSREAVKGLYQRYHLLHQKPWRKPDKKVKVLWVRKLRCTFERGNMLFAVTPITSATDSLKKHTHQATQNGMTTVLGLLKSGNLMNSTYFQILYCVWVRYTRTLAPTQHWKKDWRGSKVHQNTELWTELMVSQLNSSGIFSRIHHIAAQPQSSRVTVEIGWNTREFDRTNYLHVDVQRHLMGIERQQERMWGKCSTRLSLCKQIRSKTMVIPWTWIRKKRYSISEDSPQCEGEKWQKRWCWHSQKADIQSSVPRVRCLEEC